VGGRGSGCLLYIYTYKYPKKQKSENTDKVKNCSLQAEVRALFSYQNDNFFPLAKGHTLYSRANFTGLLLLSSQHMSE